MTVQSSEGVTAEVRVHVAVLELLLDIDLTMIVESELRLTLIVESLVSASCSS